MEEVKDAKIIIVDALKDADGFLPLHDKSDPEEIYEELEMSKKVFKKLLEIFTKKKIISIKESGIRLISLITRIWFLSKL